jgi:hypothetical protein
MLFHDPDIQQGIFATVDCALFIQNFRRYHGPPAPAGLFFAWRTRSTVPVGRFDFPDHALLEGPP